MWTFAEVRQEAENQGWDAVERPDKGGWVFTPPPPRPGQRRCLATTLKGSTDDPRNVGNLIKGMGRCGFRMPIM
jgi:hypothetical protein